MKSDKVISYNEALEIIGNRILLEQQLQQEIIRYRIGTKGLELQLEDVLNYKLRLKELGVEYDEQKGEEQVTDSESVDSQTVERKKKGKSN